MIGSATLYVYAFDAPPPPPPVAKNNQRSSFEYVKVNVALRVVVYNGKRRGDGLGYAVAPEAL